MAPSRRYVIFGGASGMGAAGARALIAAGHRLAIIDRDDVPADLGAEIAIRADALNLVQVASAVDEAAAALGGLDGGWVHVGTEHVATIEQTSAELFETTWRINVLAHAAFAKATIPHLRLAGGGALLFTSSSCGVLVEKEMFAYTVTKASVVAMARQIALDYVGDRIRANVLCPGYVDTPHNKEFWAEAGGREAFNVDAAKEVPIGRIASAEEIGAIAAMLLSDEGSYFTGQAIVPDGGLSLFAASTR